MSRNTKYQFVYVGLKQMLAELQDGERLPSFNSLCSRYDISQATLNSALDLLEKDGLIRRVPKVGVYSAKSQAARREKKITLLMPGEHEPLFAAVISVCCRFCRAHHIQLSLEFSDLDPDVECRILDRVLHDESCDGLLFLPLFPLFETRESLETLKKLAEVKPVVQFDRELGTGLRRLSDMTAIMTAMRRSGIWWSSGTVRSDWYARRMMTRNALRNVFRGISMRSGIPVSPTTRAIRLSMTHFTRTLPMTWLRF